MEDIEHIEKEMKLINSDGRRLDGRSFDELRPIRIEAGVLRRGGGFPVIQWGGGKGPPGGVRPPPRAPPPPPKPAPGPPPHPPQKSPLPRVPPTPARPPHLRRVPEGDGPVHRRDEADLRDAARCTPTSLFRYPRRHPEGGASHGGPRRAGARTAAGGRLRPGGDLMSEEIVSELMRAHVYRLASAGQRVDGRRLDEPRKGSVAPSFVQTAHGSARAKLGNTDGLVGIKMSVGEPYPDTPNTGVLSTSVELIPMASPTFEAGPPRPDSVQLARGADRGTRGSKMANMEKLCLTPKEKVLILFIVTHVLA